MYSDNLNNVSNLQHCFTLLLKIEDYCLRGYLRSSHMISCEKESITFEILMFISIIFYLTLIFIY